VAKRKPKAKTRPRPAGAYKAYSDALRSSIAADAQLARDIIAQKPEKGRALEAVLASALRRVLPGRFAIGTGFVTDHLGITSTQLDIVVYDAQNNAPIILDSNVGIFPVECVYATVEVKTSLNRKQLDSALEAIGLIRKIAQSKKFGKYARIKNDAGKPVVRKRVVSSSAAPRAYIFSLTSNLGREKIREHLVAFALKHKAHVHALLVLSGNLYFSQKVYTTSPEFSTDEQYAFERFCMKVLQGVMSARVGHAAMWKYNPKAFPD
jgi:hypothetical protein